MDQAKTVNIEDMLKKCNDFGRFQWVILFLFSVINLLSAFHYFGQTFISTIPQHVCLSPNDNNNTTIHLDECYWRTDNTTLNCNNGWHYESPYGYKSIVEEMNWVCSDSWKPTMGQSMFFLGSIVGSVAFGIAADTIGRLHTLVLANLLAFIGNLGTYFTRDVITFSISRFVAGCATDTNFVMMYILVMEYIRPSMRTFSLNICIGIFYCISCMAVPWVAVLLGTWKRFALAIAVPHLAVVLFYLVVPESAQWLISKRRIEQAIHCFKRISRINGAIVTNHEFDQLREHCMKHFVETEKTDSFWALMETPRLRRKTLILIFKSMAMTLCYDAISRHVEGLKYSSFIVFTVTSVTILPACVFIVLTQDRLGRKLLASTALLVTGLFTVSSAVLLQFVHAPMAILALSVVARLAINVAYNSGAQYAVELIPTVVRAQGVSVVHVTGYAASFCSPYILYLGASWPPGPDIILGVLLILAAFACLFLPETLNKQLPVSLQDGEAFGNDERVCEFSVFKGCCAMAKTESTTNLT